MNSKDTKWLEVFDKIGTIIMVNICCLIACIPVVTAGASLTALYATMHYCILNGEGHAVRRFWAEFKKNFGQVTIAWMILLVNLAALFTLANMFAKMTEQGYGTVTNLLRMVCAIAFFIGVLYALHVIAYMARFKRPLMKTFRSSWIIMVGHVLGDLLIFGALFVMGFIIMIQIWTVLFLPGIAMWGFAWFMDNTFYQLMSDEERQREDPYYEVDEE